MSDDGRHDGLADVINLLAAPIAGGIRTVEQMRRGIDEAFRTIDNLNTTIENLNEAATRINRLMAEVEPAVLALIPQIARTVQTADQITSMLEGPVRATAPNVEKIVNALGSPGFLTLPNQVGELMQRLTPLAQLAENAGGLFGGFRLPGMGGGRPTGPTPPAARPAPAAPPPPVAADQPAAKKSAAKKTATKTTATTKTGAAKTGAAKTAAKRTAAKKPSGR
jgi:ABC-type transporter Mla subunit MlaD